MKKAFTMIELLIVIAIVGILVSLLLPNLAMAREAAKFSVCKSNKGQQVRFIYGATNDNNKRFPWFENKGWPGNPDSNLDIMKHTWTGIYGRSSGLKVYNPVFFEYSGEPDASVAFWKARPGLVTGDVFEGDNPGFETMRCPSIEPGELRSGVGSNGITDTSFVSAFGHAFYATIETDASFGPTWDAGTKIITPLVIDEEVSPVQGYGKSGGINGGHAEAGFCTQDSMSLRHMLTRRQGAFGAIDGSVVSYVENLVDPSGNSNYRAAANIRVSFRKYEEDGFLTPYYPYWPGAKDVNSAAWNKRTTGSYGYGLKD